MSEEDNNKVIDDNQSYVTVSNSTNLDYSYGNISIDLSNVTFGTTYGAQGSVYISDSYGYGNRLTGGIKLDKDSDIELGETSLKDFIERVNQRLGILVPNPKLEKEFEQLRDLANKYKKLEAELTAQMEVWDILKSDHKNKKT